MGKMYDFQMENRLSCPHAGCTQTYTRRHRLNDHLKIAHGTEVNGHCTRNFKCPFSCGVQPYRRNIELLTHCDKVHQDLLGKLKVVTYAICFKY